MASLSNISSVHSYVTSHDIETTNLKALFTYDLDIQTAHLNLPNKQVTHIFNIYTGTNV